MLEQYRRGLMPPGELLDADDHLAVCAQCRELAAGGEAVQHALAAFTADMLALATEAPEHLSYEQIASFVSQETDEAQREAVLSHLNFCDVCAADVRSLSAFKAELFAAQDRRPAPSAFHTFQERPAALKERLAARLSA
jgi:anti-sigma factor RsiW